MDSQIYFESKDDSNKDFLFQPHCAQILSILRVFGCDSEDNSIENNLVQISTGEGKSITLAVVSTILALFNCEVNCACYSETLSMRDYEAFKHLFEKLGILDRVTYGTFNKLCERIVNRNGDIRELIQKKVLKVNNVINFVDKLNHAPIKVLLIDEVDVFMNTDFYGQSFIPVASISHPSIKELLDLIWKKQKDGINFFSISKENLYKDCENLFVDVRLFENEVRNMISDVISFENHGYVVCDNKIGYREMDRIDFNRIMGYKTYFAYKYEMDEGRITRSTNLENLENIILNGGNFSYNYLATEFSFIMGVTATLENISSKVQEDLKEIYKINKFTYAPSVYGKKKLADFNFEKDLIICSQEDYFKKIAEEIRKIQNEKKIARPIIVVFESSDKQSRFYNDKTFNNFRDNSAYLNESINAEERDTIITKATRRGQVTLITRSFGRGTNFKLHDDEIAKDEIGGTHLIQTFYSNDKAEEIQIIGRVARQGDPGSYSLVLLDEELEKFGLKLNDYKNRNPKEIFQEIHSNRDKLYEIDYCNNRKHVKDAEKRHKLSMKFLEDLKEGRNVFEFLLGQNFNSLSENQSKTIILMDATSSMKLLLEGSKYAVYEMIRRSNEFLQEKKNCFSIEFAVYRNYNAEEDSLLENSTFETNPENLHSFLTKIKPNYGWGNEAIEIGLWHANEVAKRLKLIKLY